MKVHVSPVSSVTITNRQVVNATGDAGDASPAIIIIIIIIIIQFVTRQMPVSQILRQYLVSRGRSVLYPPKFVK